jgi:peptidoglycan-associated lipoprotein
MNARPSPLARVTFLLLPLLTALLLAGCPKKTPPGAATGPAADAAQGTGSPGTTVGTASGAAAAAGAPGASGTSGGSTAGAGGTGSTSGPGSAQAPGQAAGGSTASRSAAATGTSIPSLPSPKEFVAAPELPDIHFDFDRYDIRPAEAKRLGDHAGWLKAHASAWLLIEGHTDERGTNEYNLALGERRAKATRDRLVSLGIDTARVMIITYGEERPLCTEHTEACWSQNRRAHFLVKIGAP